MNVLERSVKIIPLQTTCYQAYPIRSRRVSRQPRAYAPGLVAAIESVLELGFAAGFNLDG